MADARDITVGGRTISISRPDKLLFADAGISKYDLATYWSKIADCALPHYRGRALTMERYPDGVDAKGFFQKNAADYFPDWINTEELDSEDGSVTHVVANGADTLVYLAGQAMITPHLALARTDRPRCTDRLIFDLDPSDDDFAKVQATARALRKALDDLDLQSYVATTGSRGLHIIVPLDASADVDALRPFARGLARQVADAHPKLATTEQRKDKRGDRVLVDTFRTAYAQTAVGAYGVRARPGAPVATPVRWDEALASDMAPDKYTVRTIFKRLAQIDDPWADIDADPADAKALADGWTHKR